MALPGLKIDCRQSLQVAELINLLMDLASAVEVSGTDFPLMCTPPQGQNDVTDVTACRPVHV